MAHLASQAALWDPLTSPFEVGNTGLLQCLSSITWDSNSAPHAYTISVLTTEPPPQTLFTLFFFKILSLHY